MAHARSPQTRGADDRIRLPTPRAPAAGRDLVVGVPDASGLHRRRLVTTLDRITRVRICAVVAPAGSGKTTALAHWARRSSVDVAWWRADAAGSDPVDSLVRGMAAAVTRTDRRGTTSTDPEALIDLLAGRDSELVLVVDDLDELVGRGAGHGAGHGAGRLLERLLLATDERLHLVVCGRTRPDLNLARTELTSMVIGPSDLRFRGHETAELFRTVYGAPLAADDARRLTRSTEGWAAGLHLFHQSTAGLPPDAVHSAVGSADDQTSYVADYLSRTVLADVSADDLAFLRHTSPLEILRADWCEQLTRSPDGVERLAYLHRTGVLATSGDGRGLTLPRTVRTHLVAALREEVGRPVADAFFSEAARITVGADPVLGARTFAAGSHWAEAVAVLGDHLAAALAQPDLDWLAAAPPAVASEPVVRILLAERARRAGDLRSATALVTAIPPAADGSPWAATAESLARFVRLWTVGDQQPSGSWVEHLRAAVSSPDPGRRTDLPPPHTDLLRGIESALAGDLRTARRILAAAVHRLESDHRAACAAALVVAVLDQDGQDRMEHLAARAEDLGLPWLARIAHALGAPDRPEDVVEAEVGEADDRGDGWGAALLVAVDAAARIRFGGPADRVLEELVVRCRRIGAPALEAWARSALALSMATGNVPDAAREADSAAGFAYRAQVPGAVVVARAAAALSRGDQELSRIVAEEATDVGLGRRWADWISAGHRARPPSVVTDRPAPLAVRCFGGFDIRIEGGSPSLTGVRPRARAVLRMLALYAGQPVHREVMVDAMWPQLDPDAATHNLHVCVSGLRSALEPGVARGASRLVVRDGDRYLLALPGGSTSDLRTFDRLLTTAERARASGGAAEAIPDLEAALLLYVGEVLPEDGPTDWVVPHRDHYQLRAAEAAALLGRLHLDQGRPEAAVHALRRSIDIDPCRDASWRLLVAAHEAAGDLASAEEARRSYAEVLATLGVVATTATAVRTTRRRAPGAAGPAR